MVTRWALLMLFAGCLGVQAAANESKTPSPPLTLVILGEVQNPGEKTLPPGSRLRDLLLAAGGLTPKAGRKNSRIFRGEKPRRLPNLERCLSGDEAANPALSDGDVVQVGTSNTVRPPREYRQIAKPD